MTDHHIIDIHTGKPMEPESPVEPAPAEHITHEQLCAAIAQMMANMDNAFDLLRHMAATEPRVARTIGWRNKHGYTVTIPCVLRKLRCDLEWLERFFARGNEYVKR